MIVLRGLRILRIYANCRKVVPTIRCAMTDATIASARLDLTVKVNFFTREALRTLHTWCRRNLAGNDIGRDTKIALRAYIDLTNPRGVHVGDGTRIERDAVILAHDPTRHLHTHTYIGRNCYIGMRALIMPGVRIGDQSIILAGSLIKTDVPPHSMVVGDPARVIRSGIRTGKHGILLEADESGVEQEPEATPWAP